ncbi:MAG: hypothetical protein KJ737_15885 [Proteobacteria bacterium]|nr:hypothetical protein [Pseudomonadota bacterium]
MKGRLFFISIFLNLFFSFTAFAAPSITDSPTTISHGTTITISGKNFGIHKDYSPNKDYLPAAWENFESGVADRDVWMYDGPNGLQRTKDNQRRGSIYASRGTKKTETFTNVFGEEKTGGSGSFYNPNNTNSQVLFISAWCMFPIGTVDGLRGIDAQCKFISTLSVGQYGNQYWNISSFTNSSEVYLRLNFEDGRISSTPLRLNQGTINENEWHRFDLAIDTTKAYGKKVSAFYIDGKEYTNESNRYFLESPDCHSDGGYGCPREFSGSFVVRYFRTENFYVYFDDLYVNNTWARVEISENSTWNETASLHKEIQVSKIWSENSITFTVNQGSFQNGDTAYIFAVDENGVASNGKKIVFSAEGQCDIARPGSVTVGAF